MYAEAKRWIEIPGLKPCAHQAVPLGGRVKYQKRTANPATPNTIDPTNHRFSDGLAHHSAPLATSQMMNANPPMTSYIPIDPYVAPVPRLRPNPVAENVKREPP